MFGQVGTFFRTVGWQWRRIDATTGVIIVSTGFQVVCISYYSGNQFKERAFRVIPRKTGNFPPVEAAIAIRYEKYARHIFPRHCCTTPLPPPPPPLNDPPSTKPSLSILCIRASRFLFFAKTYCSPRFSRNSRFTR